MSFRVQDASSQRILEVLKTINVLRWCSIQHGVDVVEPTTEQAILLASLTVMAGRICRNACKHVRLTSFTCLSIDRRLSSVTPSSLTWSAIGTTEPETLTVVTFEKEWERCWVPKRTESDLSGLRERELWQHQACKAVKQSSRRWIWPRKLDGEREM